MNNIPIAPKLDLTPASKKTADEHAIDLAIEYTNLLPDNLEHKFYAEYRTHVRFQANLAAGKLRSIFQVRR